MASKRGLFGTNGIRGIVNVELTNEFITKVARSIAMYVGEGSKVIIGQDTRVSGEMIKMNVISVLLSSGINVYDAGILPTPSLQLASRRFAFFGIMVTASHNPPEYNGLKCIGRDGTELDESEEDKIEDIFFKNEYRSADWRKTGRYQRIEGLNNDYVDRVLSLVDSSTIKDSGLRVLLDCSNGPSFLTSIEILRRFNVKFSTINCNPDGFFSSHNPEPKEENLQDLMKFTSGNYDLGIAHDGDADRVAFVDELGNFIPGDKILALITKDIVQKKSGIIVLPVSASHAIEEIANKHGSKVVYTKVGAPIIARKMIEVNAIFGGEDNGGLIFPEMQYCRDGGMGMAKIIEILSKSGKKLSELLNELPEYYVRKGTVNVEKEKMKKVMEILKAQARGDRIVDIDGIKVYEGNSWVLVRPSGTEPIIRIYSESDSEGDAEKIFNKYKRIVESISKEI